MSPFLLVFSKYFYSCQEKVFLLTVIQRIIVVWRHYNRDAGQVQCCTILILAFGKISAILTLMDVLPTDLLLGGFTLQTVAVYVKNSKKYFHQLFSEQGEDHRSDSHE